MDLQEPIFKEVVKTPDEDLDTETIQEWIDVSKEYKEREESVVGMHGGRCDSAEESCCKVCGKGHVIVTGVQERESKNVVNDLTCTNPKCAGPFL